MTYLLKDTMAHFTHRINESLKLMSNYMKVWCALSHTLGQYWNFIRVIYEDILGFNWQNVIAQNTTMIRFGSEYCLPFSL